MNYISDSVSFFGREFRSAQDAFYEKRDNARVQVIAAVAFGALSLFTFIFAAYCITNYQDKPLKSLSIEWIETAALLAIDTGMFVCIFPEAFNRPSDEPLEEKLLDAVRSGYLYPVTALMQSNWIPRAMLKRVLLEAVSVGNLSAVALLIGTNRIEANSLGALYLAIDKGHTDIAAFLIAKGYFLDDASGNKVFTVALLMSARVGNAEIAALLIAKSEIEVRFLDSALLCAARIGHLNVANLLVATNEFSATILHEASSIIAARNGDWDPLIELIRAHELSDDSLNSALAIAAETGRLDMVTLLIDLIRIEDYGFGEALKNSVFNKYPGVMKALIASGRILREHFADAMHLAVKNLKFDAMMVLIDNFPIDELYFVHWREGTEKELIDCLVAASKCGRMDVVDKLMALRTRITNDAIYAAMETAYSEGRFDDVDALVDTLQYREGCLQHVIQKARQQGHLKQNGDAVLDVNGALALNEEQLRSGKRVSMSTMIKTLLGYNDMWGKNR